MGGSFLRCGRSGVLCDLDSSERKKNHHKKTRERRSKNKGGYKTEEAILPARGDPFWFLLVCCAALGFLSSLEVCTARCAFKFYCFLDFEFWILEWGSGVTYCLCCCCCCCRSDMNNETRYGK